MFYLIDKITVISAVVKFLIVSEILEDEEGQRH